MFALMLFNSQYMKVDSRIKWYIKLLNFSINNEKMPIITQEYLFKNFFELQEGVDDRFFQEFDMKRITREEFESVKQYTLSDKLFEEIEEEYGSRTKMLVEMFSNANLKFEAALDCVIKQMIQDHNGEKIEGIFNCIDAWESIKRVSDKHGFKLICFSFSSIRKVHGYRETLYAANIEGRLLSSNEPEMKYKKFLSEVEGKSILTFSNKEILALIGKERNLPLIKYIDMEPKYEVGVCTEAYQLVPETWAEDCYTDLDLLYDCRKHYKEDQYIMRHHAYFMDDYRLSRNSVRNDPAPFILSCRRIASVTSQINLKAMLWGRVSVMKKETTGFAFACAKDYTSTEKVDNLFLNYYTFGYLIPDEYMFDLEYWRARLNSNEELYFYNKNMEYLLSKYGYNLEYLRNNNEDERLRNLLLGRGADTALVNEILEKDSCYEVDYNALSSRIDIELEQGEKQVFYRSNIKKDNLVCTQLTVGSDISDKVKVVKFYPLDDLSGKARIRRIRLNDLEIEWANRDEYYSLNKYQGIDIELGKVVNGFKLEIDWDYV